MDLPPICADFFIDLLHSPCTYFTKNGHFLQCLWALYGCSASPNYLKYYLYETADTSSNIQGTFSLSSISGQTVSLNRNTLPMVKGKSYDLKQNVTTSASVNSLTWVSSNPEVASVTSGTVRALSAGTTVITVKSGQFTASCKVFVSNSNWADDVEGWKYITDNCSYAVSEWISSNGKRYYMDRNGYMVTGWDKISNIWYYFSGSGAMQTGWQKISGKWYYFNGSGAMLTGWQKINNIWYYFGGSGAMLTGWQRISEKWYYFNTSGAMLIGWQKISDKWYFFNTSGAMLTGWQKINNIWYYFESSGAMKTGWLKLNNIWYFFEDSGKMVTGSRRINGKTYRFDSNGKCLNP